MALKVWLPLNGDLQQIGCSNVIATNNGATVNTSGKIGSCYYFDGTSSSNITTTYSTAIGTSDFSIAMWIKIPTITSGSYYAICTSKAASAASAGFGIYWNYSQKKFLWSTADGSAATEIWMANTVDTIVYDKWIHLVMIRNSNDNKKGYFYINNIRYELASVPAIRNITTDTQLWIGRCTSNNYPTKMYLNDFRIYDHALSAAEVHEIAQGLVLHYKLDSTYNESSQNLCTVTRPGTGTNVTWGGHVAQWTNYDATNDPVPFTEGTKGEIIYGQNGSTGGGASRSICTIAASPSTAYTYSCYIKASDNLTYTHANFLYKYEYTAVSGGTKITEAGYFSNSRKELLENGWYRIWGTFTTQSNTNCINISFYTYPGKSVNYWLGGWQIEQKDHVTPFITPGTTRNNMIIEDSSGYGNNGIINGTLICSNDSPRYSSCAVFNGANTRINVPNLTPTELTISFWMKRGANTGTRQFMYTAWNGITCELQTNGTPTFAVNRSNYPTITGTAITIDSGWVYYCATFDTINGSKLYQNGVLKSTNNNVTPITYNITTNYIGYYNTYYNGKMSDFRIYCTALSADDVLQLYHTSAKVDNKQNLHTFELVESNSKISINKQGQTLCNELTEDTSTKFYKTDQIIEANEIIEL